MLLRWMKTTLYRVAHSFDCLASCMHDIWQFLSTRHVTWTKYRGSVWLEARNFQHKYCKNVVSESGVTCKRDIFSQQCCAVRIPRFLVSWMFSSGHHIISCYVPIFTPVGLPDYICRWRRYVCVSKLFAYCRYVELRLNPQAVDGNSDALCPTFTTSIFTAPCCYSNGAVMPSLGVCLSVCLSVTLLSTDHIHWGRWNFITRLISPMSSLAVRQISAI